MQKTKVYRVEMVNNLGHPVGTVFGRADSFTGAESAAIRAMSEKASIQPENLSVRSMTEIGDFDFDVLVIELPKPPQEQEAVTAAEIEIPEPTDGSELAKEALP